MKVQNRRALERTARLYGLVSISSRVKLLATVAILVLLTFSLLCPWIRSLHTDRSSGGAQSASMLRLVTEMRLYDIRVTVDRIEGRSVCGLEVGDYFEVTESSRVRIPAGRHFCLYALQSVLPLIPAKQRRLAAEDWLEQDNLVCCPDPEERVVMRIERIGERTLRSEDLT